MTKAKRSTEQPDFAGPGGIDARLVERKDGYYWLAADGKREFGPFETLEEALADMEVADESEPDSGDALTEAEQELGIADWIDPDTGEPAEGMSPRIEDH
jgi:hypothetical protein